MVDAIGAKPVTTDDRRIAPVRSAGSLAPAPTALSDKGDGATMANVAHDLAAQPPVDIDRVASLKQAIAEGRYSIAPETIADRMIAQKLEWTQHDPS